ncbi:MAG: uroporphyrinogen-III C-methyltransferase [Candidatus Hydrogenedentes bacterium]|nr:uroporphyrinogen-III C-methyltransferase [Candidatus Hydrogenedentota bacterium]
MNTASGKVYLVGAGPGAPDLITVRGRECLERADVVIHDHLVDDALLQFAPRAERIFVGKKTEHHTLLQEEINRLLVEQARRVSRVVRLKGGDPFVFGRGGEEALALAEAGIPFEIIPGITAGVAAPAYAGIPITHRGIAGSLTLISGHDDPTREDSAVDLAQVVSRGTLVFYMAVKNIPAIARELIRLGREPRTPVAVIEWGTYPKQRTLVGSLADIHEICARERITPPAVVVVGDVVSLQSKLGWFECRPLSGKRIVVTRARAQAGDLVRQLQELGADVFEFPTIEIESVPPQESMDYVGDYDWIILTSVNGVEMLFERMEQAGQDARDLAGVKLCVIGSATAEAVRKRFLRIDLMPEKYVAEHLLEALLKQSDTLEGKRFLLPRADIARSFLPVELRQRGAEVKELVAYRTVVPKDSGALADALVAYQPHLISFTSSSTATNFCEILGPERLARIKHSTAIACLGPITAKTAEDLGLPVAIQPDQHDIPNLVQVIVAWARARG